MPQGQYSRIENGKVEPTLTTLAKLAEALEVSLAELVKQNGDLQEELNLPLLEKVKALEELSSDEQAALLKIIDVAIHKKRLHDSLSRALEDG